MARPASEKKTKQLGWRLRADLVDAFEQWCAAERKDKTLELEYIIEKALTSQGISISPERKKP